MDFGPIWFMLNDQVSKLELTIWKRKMGRKAQLPPFRTTAFELVQLPALRTTAFELVQMSAL